MAPWTVAWRDRSVVMTRLSNDSLPELRPLLQCAVAILRHHGLGVGGLSCLFQGPPAQHPNIGALGQKRPGHAELNKMTLPQPPRNAPGLKEEEHHLRDLRLSWISLEVTQATYLL